MPTIDYRLITTPLCDLEISLRVGSEEKFCFPEGLLPIFKGWEWMSDDPDPLLFKIRA